MSILWQHSEFFESSSSPTSNTFEIDSLALDANLKMLYLRKNLIDVILGHEEHTRRRNYKKRDQGTRKGEESPSYQGGFLGSVDLEQV